MIVESFDQPHTETNFLHDITGYEYEFALATIRAWGHIENKENSDNTHFYQLMPVTEDDGFFDWYCLERQYYQFHKTKEMAVAYFLRYWILWSKAGKPSPY